MADEQLSVLVSLVDEISKPLGNIASELTNFATGAKSAGELASSALSLLGKAAVAGVAVEGIREVAKAGIEAQSSLHDLSIAVKAAGKDYETWKGQLSDTATALRQSTRFDITDIRAGLTNLIQFTGDLEISERALAVAADIAAARHVSLADAANVVARGIEGVGRGLRQYGIILDAHEQKMLAIMDESQRFEFLQGKIEAHYSGAAAASLETFDGQWAHLKNTFHEFLEGAGGPLAEWLTNVLGGLNSIADKITELAPSVQNIGERWGFLAGGGLSLKGLNANQYGGYGASGSWKQEIPPQFAASWAMSQAEIAEGMLHPDTWKSQIDKLVESINEVERNWKDAKDAGQSFDAFVQVNAEHLQKLAEQAGMGGIRVDGLATALFRAADALRQIPQKTSLEDVLNNKAFAGTFPGPMQTLVGPVNMDTGQLDPRAAKANQQALDEFEKQQIEMNERVQAENLQAQLRNAKLIASYYEENVVRPFEDAFADLALTGGKNLGQIFSAELAKGARNAGGALLDAIKGIATGGGNGQITESNGTFYYAGRQFQNQTDAVAARNQDNSNFAAAGNAVIGVAGFAYQASQGGMSPLQGALSGASAGYSVGTAVGALAGLETGSMAGPVGALVGAFVGALIAALSETVPSITTYARPIIKNGLAQLTDVVGELAGDPAQQMAWLQKIQDSFDMFRNGYVNIFLSLPDAIRDQVMPSMVSVLRRIATGQVMTSAFPGPIQPAPGGTPYSNPDPKAPYISTADWNAAMNNWLNTTMPTGVMEAFKPAMDKLFSALGLTEDKFAEIWKKAEGLDPKAALAFLSGYADVVGTLQDLLKKISQSVNVGGGGLFADTMAQGTMSFADQLRKADKAIIDLGTNLQYLTGQAQIDGAKQLNTLIQNRYELEKQMVQQIVNLVTGARQTLGSDVFGLQLQGKTPQQQYALYSTHLHTLETSLGSATTADQANQIYQQIRSTILSMSGLFPNDQGINAWAQTELTREETAFETTMHRFGQEIDNANTAFENQMTPIVALFTTTTQDFALDLSTASDSVAAMDASAKSASVSLINLASAADAFTSVLQRSGFVSNVRTSRAA